MQSTYDGALRHFQRVVELAVHDLKDPLAVVRSSLEWLEAENPFAREEVADALRDAAGSARYLGNVVEELQLFAQLLEPIACNRERVAASALSADVATTVRARAGEHPVVIHEEPTTVFVDADANLLDRAVRALAAGVVRCAPPRAEIQVATYGRDGVFVVTVAVGLHEDVPEVVDEEEMPFGGLAVTLGHRIVRLHGGSVRATASERGAAVVIGLPGAAHAARAG